MAELAQGLGLDLADTLTGDIELLAHLFQGAGAAVHDAEAQLKNLLFPGGQGVQHLFQLLAQQGEAGGLGGLRGVLVGQEVAQLGVLLLADGGFQTDRLLGDLQDIPDLFHRHIHLGGDLLGGGVVAQLLEKLAGNADGLVDGLHHVYGDADGAGLVRDGAGDGLADPPGGVGGELVALGVVKLFHRFDQTQVALLDQIQKQHAPAHIALGDGNHQTEVGLSHALFRLFVAVGHALGQRDLLIRRKQRHFADLLQVHAHGVVGGEAVGQLVGPADLLFRDLFDVRNILHIRQHIVVNGGQHVCGCDVNVDVVLLQGLVEFVDDLPVQIHFLKTFQFLGAELSGLLALFDQIVQALLRGLGRGLRRGVLLL